MSRDFFLLNRSHQIARLCSTVCKASFELTTKASKLPAKLQEFNSLVRRVCAIAQATSTSEGVTLLEADRAVLDEFERAIVRHRFSEDEQIKGPAVALIRAVFADAEYFCGLKPLPQYTDRFAYELLFPSWLNLLKACMLPRAVNGKPRLAGEQQGALFSALAKYLNPSAQQLNLVAYLTFIASRYDAPTCEGHLQRLIDLYEHLGSKLLESIDEIDRHSPDARDFAERLGIYLTVKYVTISPPLPSPNSISSIRLPRRALPAGVGQSLSRMEETSDWENFFSLANTVCLLVERLQPIDGQFAELLAQYPEKIPELFALLARQQDGSAGQLMPAEGQFCLARLLHAVGTDNPLGTQACYRFASDMAYRMQGFTQSALDLFGKQLIDDDETRARLLDSCQDDKKRRELAAELIARGRQTTDDGKFLQWVECATVVLPDAESQAAQASLQALDAVISNRSIGNKELSDLVGDLRASKDGVVDCLANPIMSLAGKSPRLAALYLTLNEVAQKLAATQSVENFSVVRAKFAKLTNMEIE
jgi:hypothetical protein